jgi:hypothetical protein
VGSRAAAHWGAVRLSCPLGYPSHTSCWWGSHPFGLPVGHMHVSVLQEHIIPIVHLRKQLMRACRHYGNAAGFFLRQAGAVLGAVRHTFKYFVW